MPAEPESVGVHGLTEGEIDLLRVALRGLPDINRVWLFGSRAKGTARPNSDIDLAVEGLDSALKVAAAVERLNELPLPYQIDLQAWEDIKNHELREHISRVGILLYERQRED